MNIRHTLPHLHLTDLDAIAPSLQSLFLRRPKAQVAIPFRRVTHTLIPGPGLAGHDPDDPTFSTLENGEDAKDLLKFFLNLEREALSPELCKHLTSTMSTHPWACLITRHGMAACVPKRVAQHNPKDILKQLNKETPKNDQEKVEQAVFERKFKQGHYGLLILASDTSHHQQARQRHNLSGMCRDLEHHHTTLCGHNLFHNRFVPPDPHTNP